MFIIRLNLVNSCPTQKRRKMSEKEIFIIDDDAKVTFINQITGEKWSEWKLYKDCNEEEKRKINLAQYPTNCICLDRDLKSMSEEGIENDYNGILTMMRKRGLVCFYSYRTPHGYHILIPMDGLDKLDDDLRKEVRRYYVNLFLSDPAKISDRGVVSLPNKPHFKNGIIYPIKDNFVGTNFINDGIMIDAKQTVEKNKLTIKKVNEDVDFNNYFEEDKFFKHIKNNVIPDGTGRDIIIFPNLAVAAVKSGKTKKEIDEILKPIIKDNFPGKVYAEFEGWLRKAAKAEIKDYNPIQLNTWGKTFTAEKRDFYDLNPIKILKEEEHAKTNLSEIQAAENKFKFYWDCDFLDLKTQDVKWLVENWIAKGDINWIVGKAASFKTTICLSLAYAIANGKLAFNKYPTHKCKVLYLDEENSPKNLQAMISRIKKGLDIKEGQEYKSDVVFASREHIKLDNNDDLKHLIDFIKKNNIEFLICDSFRRFITFDENSANDMNRFMDNMKTLQKICSELTITLLHHLKKDNSGYTSDLRDMLRGSSDIVNSADSIIGIDRKHNKNSIIMQHIKNRSGLEMEQKVILIDNGDDGKSAYFYESDKEADKSKLVTKKDECANAIVTFLNSKGIKTFERKELKELEGKYSSSTVNNALRTLQEENSMIDDGTGIRNPHRKLTLL